MVTRDVAVSVSIVVFWYKKREKNLTVIYEPVLHKQM